tara:strand:- start:2676 stop:2855 length:180 start_codon:yes stop_codon:yes gene_type:complete
MRTILNEIVFLLNNGSSKDEVFTEITKKMHLTKSQKQEIANLISQIETRDVFEKGKTPI